MEFNPKEFLRLLNSKDGRLMEFQLRSSMRWSGGTPAPEEIYLSAPGAFRARLRTLVNEWIATGKKDDGADYPRDRAFTRYSAGYEAIAKWNQQHPLVSSVSLTGELVLPKNGARAWSKATTQGTDDPITKMEERAINEFLQMLQSPFKYLIARCDRCSQSPFFFRKKLRPYYNNGSFCPDCRRAAAAKRKTYRDRNKTREAILKPAATAWAKWSSLSKTTQAKYGTQESYVLSKIKHTGRTIKFVTRNRGTIEGLAAKWESK